MLWIKRRQIPHFYEEMLISFKALPLKRQPTCGKEVRRQLIWHNLDIQVGHKSLTNRILSRRNIKLIDDFVNEEGIFLSYADFLAQYSNLNINPLVYMGWKQAVPEQWKRMLVNSQPLTIGEREKEVQVMISTKEVPISCVKTSFFKTLYLPKTTSTARKRWEAEGVNFVDNWREIYLIPFKATKSTKLQSLQFRILHGTFQHGDFCA